MSENKTDRRLMGARQREQATLVQESGRSRQIGICTKCKTDGRVGMAAAQLPQSASGRGLHQGVLCLSLAIPPSLIPLCMGDPGPLGGPVSLKLRILRGGSLAICISPVLVSRRIPAERHQGKGCCWWVTTARLSWQRPVSVWERCEWPPFCDTGR